MFANIATQSTDISFLYNYVENYIILQYNIHNSKKGVRKYGENEKRR